MRALTAVLFVDKDTKTVKWPSDRQSLLKVVAYNMRKYGLPAGGSADGSMLPLPKPASTQAGNNPDAWWSWKGHCAQLLLVVCDGEG